MSHNPDPDHCKSSRDFIRLATSRGAEIREGGSHTKIIGPGGGIVPIPRHTGDLPTGTRRSIARMLKLIGVLTVFVLFVYVYCH